MVVSDVRRDMPPVPVDPDGISPGADEPAQHPWRRHLRHGLIKVLSCKIPTPKPIRWAGGHRQRPAFPSRCKAMFRAGSHSHQRQPRHLPAWPSPEKSSPSMKARSGSKQLGELDVRRDCQWKAWPWTQSRRMAAEVIDEKEMEPRKSIARRRPLDRRVPDLPGT